MQTTTTCPACKREVKIKRNKFGDATYARHKQARAWDKSGKVTREASEFLRTDRHPDDTPIWELDCPMGGQPLD